MKRLLDLAAVLLSVPLVLPVLTVAALAVRLLLGPPVLFLQLRAGLAGRPFRLRKLRTMTDAQDDEGNLLPDEARLTRLGRFLRAWSIDELPQLFNVVRGEMSLVGPRPLHLHYLPRYTADQMRRHDIPPGITGWAQVNGRNETSWEERFELDLWYVDHRSFLLDLRILLLTVRNVVTRRGVNASPAVTMPEFLGSAHLRQ